MISRVKEKNHTMKLYRKLNFLLTPNPLKHTQAQMHTPQGHGLLSSSKRENVNYHEKYRCEVVSLKLGGENEMKKEGMV